MSDSARQQSSSHDRSSLAASVRASIPELEAAKDELYLARSRLRRQLQLVSDHASRIGKLQRKRERIRAVVERVDDILEIDSCREDARKAIARDDVGAACTHLRRLRQVQGSFPGATLGGPSDGAGAAGDDSLDEMEQRAARSVASKLRRAMEAGDAAAVGEHCQLLALIGRSSEGLRLFLQFVQRRVNDVAAAHMASLGTPSPSPPSPSPSQGGREGAQGLASDREGADLTGQAAAAGSGSGAAGTGALAGGAPRWEEALRNMASGSARGAVDGLSAGFNAVLAVLREALVLSQTAFADDPSAPLALLGAARRAAEAPLARAVDAFVDGPAVRGALAASAASGKGKGRRGSARGTSDGKQQQGDEEGGGDSESEASLTAVATGSALLLQRIERFLAVLRDTAEDAVERGRGRGGVQQGDGKGKGKGAEDGPVAVRARGDEGEWRELAASCGALAASYGRAEGALLSAGLRRAVALEEVGGSLPCSTSAVGDCMYVARVCVDRALSTGNADCLCGVLHGIAAQLGDGLFERLRVQAEAALQGTGGGNAAAAAAAAAARRSTAAGKRGGGAAGGGERFGGGVLELGPAARRLASMRTGAAQAQARAAAAALESAGEALLATPIRLAADDFARAAREQAVERGVAGRAGASAPGTPGSPRRAGVSGAGGVAPLTPMRGGGLGSGGEAATPGTPGGATAAEAAEGLSRLSAAVARRALAVNSAWEAAEECAGLVRHAREQALGEQGEGASTGAVAKATAAVHELQQTASALQELSDAAVSRFAMFHAPQLRSALEAMAGRAPLVRFDGEGHRLGPQEQDALFQEEVLEPLARAMAPVELLLLPEAAREVAVRAAQAVARRMQGMVGKRRFVGGGARALARHSRALADFFEAVGGAAARAKFRRLQLAARLLSAPSRSEALEELAAAAEATTGTGTGTRSRSGSGSVSVTAPGGSGKGDSGGGDSESEWWRGDEEAGERNSLSAAEVRGLLALRTDW